MPLHHRVVRLLVAALLLGGCAAEPRPVAADGLGVDAGEGPLPTTTLPTLADPQEQVSTDAWRGTPTVVNFWATWCEFCVEELPELQAASEALDGRVRFVGVDRQDPREEALALLERTGVTYAQLASPDGEWFVRVGGRGMPTTLFVDGDNEVRFRHTGPLDEATTLALVEEHLGVAAP